jgi:hypothetical protein
MARFKSWLPDADLESKACAAFSMAATLATNVNTDGSIPKAWRDLPNIAPLEKAGRARCTGMPCSGVRVYRDDSEGLWLTFAPSFMAGRIPQTIGPGMVSLDADAAKFQTNVWSLTFAGY